VSSEPAEVRWRGEPLPRGRHKLSAETVRASQRERLLRAMLESVAERGYAATTVPQVVAAARVSRNSFYELFEDKTDCFLALLDQAADEMLESLFALAAEPDWLTALRRGVRVYLRWWQDQPALSRAYFVELPVAGARAMDQRERAFARFEAMFAELARRARAEQPELSPVSPLALRLLVVGITELVGGEVRAGRVGELVRLERELLALVVRLLADDATARRA
jgi:AcrR family transcriptional regulator